MQKSNRALTQNCLANQTGTLRSDDHTQTEFASFQRDCFQLFLCFGLDPSFGDIVLCLFQNHSVKLARIRRFRQFK
jgi:hypothetical protein